MEQQRQSIQSCCQAKLQGDEGKESNDNSCQREETATSPTKQVYPWMKEFRTKGTKQHLYLEYTVSLHPTSIFQGEPNGRGSN